MFVDFLGYPYLRNYVPTNVKQKSELSCIVMQQTNEITPPRTKKILSIHEPWSPRINVIYQIT